MQLIQLLDFIIINFIKVNLDKIILFLIKFQVIHFVLWPFCHSPYFT